MSLCRHESGGRQRRSRRTLLSQAEVPGVLRLMKTPQLGVFQQTSEGTFLHPSFHQHRVKSRLGL